MKEKNTRQFACLHEKNRILVSTWPEVAYQKISSYFRMNNDFCVRIFIIYCNYSLRINFLTLFYVPAYCFVSLIRLKAPGLW